MRLYRGNVFSEREDWIKAWSAWFTREPQAHPGYAEAFLQPTEEALCAVGEGIMMPMILRPLADGRSDAMTPYGYGGPFQMGIGNPDLFWDALDDWAASTGIVSLFARMPLYGDAPFRGDTIELMPNVVVDLRQSSEGRWMDYSGKVRRNVKTAQRAGISIEEDPSGSRLEEFMAIYSLTMDRRGAEDGYRFDAAFYRKLLRELPDSTTFFHAIKDGRVVSTEFVLYGPKIAYFFLGGTDDSSYPDRPNDLLKHTILDALSARGIGAYVLGGGYGEDDGILRYKRSFAPQGVMPYRVGRRTFDLAASAALVERRHALEAGWVPCPGFFPAYRAPAQVAA